MKTVKNNYIKSDSISSYAEYGKLPLQLEKLNYGSQKPYISILLPTRERIESLCLFVKSLINNANDISLIELIMYVDEDDIQTRNYSVANISMTKITGPRLNMGQYNSICYKYSSGTVIMLGNDDVTVETKGWDNLLIQEVSKIPDDIYLAYPDDGYNHKSLSTFPILSRKTCDLLVHPYPPIYKRLFIDTHLMDVFMRFPSRERKKRLIFLNKLKFQHHQLGSHSECESSNKRTDIDDDLAFVSLRSIRESQSKILMCAISGNRHTLLHDKFVTQNKDCNFISRLVTFFNTFINDNGLPYIIRIKYFIRFSGHFFMVNTLTGFYFSKLSFLCKKKLQTMFA